MNPKTPPVVFALTSILFAIACLAFGGCEKSQSDIDIAAEQALTGKAKEDRAQYYRDSAVKEPIPEGSSEASPIGFGR